MMNHHFSEAENKAWLESLPKKSVAVKVIVKSDNNNILLVKPNYKPTWQLPGGGVEPNEEPREAAIREIAEELGLRIGAHELRLIDSIFRREHDNLILIYEYTKKIPESTQLSIQEEELEGVKFENPSTVGIQLSGYYHGFWAAYIKS